MGTQQNNNTYDGHLWSSVACRLHLSRSYKYVCFLCPHFFLCAVHLKFLVQRTGPQQSFTTLNKMVFSTASQWERLLGQTLVLFINKENETVITIEKAALVTTILIMKHCSVNYKHYVAYSEARASCCHKALYCRIKKKAGNRSDISFIPHRIIFQHMCIH